MATKLALSLLLLGSCSGEHVRAPIAGCSEGAIFRTDAGAAAILAATHDVVIVIQTPPTEALAPPRFKVKSFIAFRNDGFTRQPFDESGRIGGNIQIVGDRVYIQVDGRITSRPLRGGEETEVYASPDRVASTPVAFGDDLVFTDASRTAETPPTLRRIDKVIATLNHASGVPIRASIVGRDQRNAWISQVTVEMIDGFPILGDTMVHRVPLDGSPSVILGPRWAESLYVGSDARVVRAGRELKVAYGDRTGTSVLATAESDWVLGSATRGTVWFADERTLRSVPIAGGPTTTDRTLSSRIESVRAADGAVFYGDSNGCVYER